MWKNVVGAVLLLGVMGCHAMTYYDPVMEAVVIDDTVIFDPSKFEPGEEDRSAATPRPEGYCVPPTGGDGVCIPLRECFPYVDFMMQEDANNQISGYVTEIINATEPCSDENGYVCCPNYSYAKLPAKKPAVLPQFPTPTTNKPGALSSSTTAATTTTSAPKNQTKPNPTKPKQTCGTFVSRTDDNVVGGQYASKGQFPWAVAITDNGRQFCGGSLIKEDYVLTAAHCVQQLRNAGGVRVLIGGHNIGVTEAGRESRSVSKILYHRSFAMQHLQNDVALLQLSTPVKYTTYIQPICLNSEELTYKEKVDLAGWGKTGNYGSPSKTLKTVNMPLISPEACKRTYQGTNAPPMGPGMICAGSQAPLKDACNGDSGGPLTLKKGEDKATQVGVVSWGIGCGEKPGVYTKVSHYLPWITKNSK
ncbi:trypsin-2 [Folsomia candida]|uniref:trypsin-2 n=1 Tax=Folsomia candida TaxID=158441 RepID=UPI000B8F5FC9|nr:trypsin-2 [Folsomia candida]